MSSRLDEISTAWYNGWNVSPADVRLLLDIAEAAKAYVGLASSYERDLDILRAALAALDGGTT